MAVVRAALPPLTYHDFNCIAVANERRLAAETGGVFTLAERCHGVRRKGCRWAVLSATDGAPVGAVLELADGRARFRRSGTDQLMYSTSDKPGFLRRFQETEVRR